MKKTSPSDPYFHPETWHEQAAWQNISTWLGQSRKCPACGKTHAIQTKQIKIKEDTTQNMQSITASLELTGPCLLVMDENTRQAAGSRILAAWDHANIQPVVLPGQRLHADEKGLGMLLAAMQDKPNFVIACGSGTLTDIVRYNAYMTKTPFIAYATAASVDGFASGTTPLMIDGYKKTYPGVAPMAVVCDPNVLAEAPAKMTAAGFGDVLAKVVALLDWRLAYWIEGEPYCPLIAAIVDLAVKASLDDAQDLALGKKDPQRHKEACARLMQALTLTGIGMQMMGTSRPASGADHQISHLLEMTDLRKNKSATLHGDKVGIGTLISMEIYRRLFANGKWPKQRPHLSPQRWQKEIQRVYGPQADQALRINPDQPPQGLIWQQQKETLRDAMDAFGYDIVRRFDTLLYTARDRIEAMGGPVRPDQLGYDRQETFDAIAYGKENRPKLTVLRLAERFGWLYDLAEELADGLPRGKIY